MDAQVQRRFEARRGTDPEAAYAALVELLALAEAPVPWAYAVWDDLVADLVAKDAHKRSFAAQMLARLAISDPEGRLMRDFPALAAQMHDPQSFVAGRHALQSLWRVGLAGPEQAKLAEGALVARFHGCVGEKNAHLIRQDAVVALAELARAVGDGGAIAEVAEALVAGEADEKLRKKFGAAWRKARKG